MNVTARVDAFIARISLKYHGQRRYKTAWTIDRYSLKMRASVNRFYEMCVEYGDEERGAQAVSEFNHSVLVMKYIREHFWFLALGVEQPIEVAGNDLN